MRGYANSRLRLALLVMAAGLILLAGHATFAQTASGTGSAAPAAAPEDHGWSFGAVFMLVAHKPDPIVFVILALSITGVALIIQGFIQNRRSVFMPQETTDLMKDMIAQRRFKELLEYTETDPGFVSQAVNRALKRAPNYEAMKEAMETAVGEQTAERFRKIEYLNIIGNLGPLLGLLGTVLGMIDAFENMSLAGGSYKPAQLAGGISMALTNTFLGLMLAVPCLAAFGVLRTMVDRLTIRGALEAEELLLMIKPAAPGGAPAAPPRPVGAGMPATPPAIPSAVRPAPLAPQA